MKFLAKTLVGCALCAVSALTSLSLAAPNNAVVVYFTLLHNREGGDTNGVGNTQRVAQAIAAQTNSQLMEIKVAKLYPSDYDETVDIGRDELDANTRPALAAAGNPDVASYQDIYLGFPNWWSSYPRAVATWLDGQNMAGKNVYVFMTHGGSRFGDAIADLTEALPQSKIERVIALNDRNCRNMSDEELAEEVADALAELD